MRGDLFPSPIGEGQGEVGFWITLLFLFLFNTTFAQKDLQHYVDPFIGTAGHAHTFPGACYPFGMMQLSPDTRTSGWDGCSGYYYADDTIYGFTHTHLSGTGCSDYGDILLMPVPKVPLSSMGNVQSLDSYYSPYSPSDEKASPGYYSVKLKEGNIKAELTVGKYAGMHRYIYTKDDACCLMLDLKHRNEVISSEVKWISDTEVCGYRETKAWTKDKWIYFDLRFSKPAKDIMVFDKHCYNDPTAKSLNSKDVRACYTFKHTDTLLVKIGISAISVENAKENLVHDIPGWDFDGTLKKTQKAWNDCLSKIEVSSKSDTMLTKFYTALYHTAIHPSLYTDVNGQYRGRDNKTHTVKGFDMYTVFSLWDTYRSLHPLLTIIDTNIDRQFIQTFLKQYEQGGMLPVWELSANETNCMIGYHSVSVINDAYQKGIRGFDAEEALKAMEHSADDYTRGNGGIEEYGYIPADKSSESVSQTLECAYDDWCIAQMAKSLGKMDDYKRYIQLAQAYKNVFNPNNDFMQGRENGRFCVPFDPKAVTFNYTEANAWQYNFYTPQDISGLIYLYGSKEKLAMKLDTLFTTSSKMDGRQQPDITGMIGQYAQGNEPSHHMAYLYNYVGQPWKTAEYVHEIENFYTAKPDGICGNDDCGALSAWYVMSAMGLYQVCPGDGQFELTTPLFDTVKIHLENGKTFLITTNPHQDYEQYISAATLNGKDYRKSFLPYTDLMKGGLLKYDVGGGNTYSTWGTGNDVPVDSIPTNENITPLPYLEYDNSIFKDSLLISLKAFSPTDTVFFDTTHCIDLIYQHPFTKPFYIYKNTWITFWRNRARDFVTGPLPPFNETFERDCNASFTKIPKGRKIKIVSKPNRQYTAGGPEALIDFQHASTDFHLGKWQGYQYQDFEAVVDLGKTETVKNVSAEFLQDALSYIYMPTYVDFSISNDSIHFTPVAHVVNTIADTMETPTIKSLGKEIPAQQVRYVKVFAKNYGQLPKWHPGYPDSAFIFIDEIEIK
ncbi:MAG TPA: GH92 family glycosyl hydrolase [Bacteroidia bacterium]|nr:GH92 family glycosyl hydrolase [Bacteroidia bacterium]